MAPRRDIDHEDDYSLECTEGTGKIRTPPAVRWFYSAVLNCVRTCSGFAFPASLPVWVLGAANLIFVAVLATSHTLECSQGTLRGPRSPSEGRHANTADSRGPPAVLCVFDFPGRGCCREHLHGGKGKGLVGRMPGVT